MQGAVRRVTRHFPFQPVNVTTVKVAFIHLSVEADGVAPVGTSWEWRLGCEIVVVAVEQNVE